MNKSQTTLLNYCCSIKEEKKEMTASKMKLKIVFISHIYCNDCNNNLLVCARQINTCSTGCNNVGCRLPGLRLQISSPSPHFQQRDQTQNNAFPTKQPSTPWCYIPQATQLPEVMERARRRQLQKYSPRTSEWERAPSTTRIFLLEEAKDLTYPTVNKTALLNPGGRCSGVTARTPAHPRR